jgi:hypothetical protein
MRKMYKAFCPVWGFLLAGIIQAQNFHGNGGPIPDDGSYIEFEIAVNGLADPLSPGFGLEHICLDIEHEWMSHLDIWLVAPDGTIVLLTSANGWNGYYYANTCFKDQSATSILAGDYPFTGEFRPMGQLGRVNNGQDGNGTWKLRIFDSYAYSSSGTLSEWSLQFGDQPSVHIPFQSSDLPIVVIDTEDRLIRGGDQVMGTMFIVDNGPGMLNDAGGPYNNFMGHIGIKRRGWSSQMAPKKSFSIELWDVNGNEIDAALLGMPPHEDWALVANHFDKSFLNNTLAYTLAREMGHYAARTRHVEVVLNGDHHGVYVLSERIKRDQNRVNIARLDSTHNSGDDVTGGYIFKLDKENHIGWLSTVISQTPHHDETAYFHYHYPKVDRITPEQSSYLQAYVDSFETTLFGENFTDPVNGYARYIDVPSFIDYFLVNELSRNVDGYRISTYLHKNRNSLGGKLKAGPVWDYDIAFGNANYCSANSTTGWSYELGMVCPNEQKPVPFWWRRLLEDPVYQWMVRCRWEELRQGIFSTTSIHHYLDSMATHLEEAQQRNFFTWPVLGAQTWTNPEPIPPTYAAEIQARKTWIQARAEWLDQNLPMSASACTTGISQEDDSGHPAPFPNPFNDHIMVAAPRTMDVTIDLLDVLGRPVMAPVRTALSTVPRALSIPPDLPRGGYLLRIMAQDGTTTSHRIFH